MIRRNLNATWRNIGETRKIYCAPIISPTVSPHSFSGFANNEYYTFFFYKKNGRFTEFASE